LCCLKLSAIPNKYPGILVRPSEQLAQALGGTSKYYKSFKHDPVELHNHVFLSANWASITHNTAIVHQTSHTHKTPRQQPKSRYWSGSESQSPLSSSNPHIHPPTHEPLNSAPTPPSPPPTPPTRSPPSHPTAPPPSSAATVPPLPPTDATLKRALTPPFLFQNEPVQPTAPAPKISFAPSLSFPAQQASLAQLSFMVRFHGATGGILQQWNELSDQHVWNQRDFISEAEIEGCWANDGESCWADWKWYGPAEVDIHRSMSLWEHHQLEVWDLEVEQCWWGYCLFWWRWHGLEGVFWALEKKIVSGIPLNRLSVRLLKLTKKRLTSASRLNVFKWTLSCNVETHGLRWTFFAMWRRSCLLLSAPTSSMHMVMSSKLNLLELAQGGKWSFLGTPNSIILLNLSTLIITPLWVLHCHSQSTSSSSSGVHNLHASAAVSCQYNYLFGLWSLRSDWGQRFFPTASRWRDKRRPEYTRGVLSTN